MTITYSNGTALNAVLLSRGNDSIRTAVIGEDDARSFTLIGGTWVSEDCEPVKIEFGSERHGQANGSTEADCICSKPLASRLISMLLAGSQGDDVLEDMLWVFCAEGERVRAADLGPASVDSQLLN